MDKEKHIYLFHGAHGSGKTFWAKRLARGNKSLFWNADLRESRKWEEWRVETLDSSLRQELFMDYNRDSLALLIFSLDHLKEIQHIFVDFGPYQILAYHRLFNEQELYKQWEKESENIIRNLEEVAVVHYYVIVPSDEMRIWSIKNRNRKEVEWELKTAKTVEQYILEELEKRTTNKIVMYNRKYTL